MAKKKGISKDLKMVLTVLVFALAIGAFCMMFVPAVTLSVTVLGQKLTSTVPGLHAVFGHTETGSSVLGSYSVETYKFCFGALIGYALALVAALASILAYKSKGKLLYYIVALVLIASGVLIFCEGTFVASVNEIKDPIVVSLAAGPIVGGILSIVGGLVSGATGYLAK